MRKGRLTMFDSFLRSVVSETAGVCQVGRDVTFTARPDEQPCEAVPTHRLMVRTETTGDYVFTFCAAHHGDMCNLEGAEDIIVFTAGQP